MADRRTKVDSAHLIKDLIDVHYANAKKIVLVMDQLNTRQPSVLYNAFTLAEAQRPAVKVKIHPTPKCESWLNPSGRGGLTRSRRTSSPSVC